MILVDRPSASCVLLRGTVTYLADRQEKANGYKKRSKVITTAWSTFLGTKAKEDVVRKLDAVFHHKCAYCEQVAAADIEHFWPKSDYPRKMFRWNNFLRGCKNCNNKKLAKFPMSGNTRLLIDPCIDDPLDYFWFDFTTGNIAVNPDAPKQQRAEKTRDMFDLDHEPLRDERRKKLQLVLYLLARVVNENPVMQDTKDRLKDELSPRRQWLGIIRQLFTYETEFDELVERAKQNLPEINDWIEDWI